MSRRLGLGGMALLAVMPLRADDAVEVTIEAADPTLAVGESTTVTVYGRIAADIEPDSEQIFFWYVDVLNSDGSVAGGYGNLQTPTSDNADAPASSDGQVDGDDLRGVFDSFLDRSGAGKGGRVVLLQFEITAQAPGTTTVSVAPGTTVGALDDDFVVVRSGSGSYTGGNYTAASVQISVGGEVSLEPLDFRLSRTGDQVELSFNPLAGYDHTVQWSADLGASGWTDLPGGPHNAGTASETVAGQPRRFYRVSVEPR